MTDGAILTVNGETRQYDGVTPFPNTLSELIRELGLDAIPIVAEVNSVIIKRDEYSSCPLANGDTVELVRFVGGG